MMIIGSKRFEIFHFAILLVWPLMAILSGAGTSTAGSMSNIDSLKAVLANLPVQDEGAAPDTVKIKLLDDLAWEYKYSRPDTAAVLCQTGLALLGEYLPGDGNSVSSRYLWLRAEILNSLGVFSRIQSDYPQALDYYFKSLQIKEKLGYEQGIADAYGNIGILYKNLSEPTLALEYYLKALAIYEKLGHVRNMATAYNNIGNIYYIQIDYPLALDYYRKSLKSQEALGNRQGLAMACSNIGVLYMSAYEKSQKHLHSEGDSSRYVSLGDWTLNNPGAMLDTAMYYQQKSLAIDKENGDAYGMTFDLSGIASIYNFKMDYIRAAFNYKLAADLADSLHAYNEGSNAHLLLSETYAKMKKYQDALEHSKQYAQLRDQVFNEERSKSLGKLEANHELEMAEIKRTVMEKERQYLMLEVQNRRNNLQYSGILIAIVTLFVSLLFIGKYHLPVRIVEGVIFLAFLILFEFLLVLTDPYVEQYISGEPVYKLLVNAALAALIFPLHSFFERLLKKRLFTITFM